MTMSAGIIKRYQPSTSSTLQRKTLNLYSCSSPFVKAENISVNGITPPGFPRNPSNLANISSTFSWMTGSRRYTLALEKNGFRAALRTRWTEWSMVPMDASGVPNWLLYWTVLLRLLEE